MDVIFHSTDSVDGQLKVEFPDGRGVVLAVEVHRRLPDGAGHRPQENLRLKLLERLVRDEIQRRQPRNLAKAKSFRELLEATLERYHKRIIDAAAVVKAMIQIKKDMEADQRRAREFNLADDALAFCDAVATSYAGICEQPFLRDLIHDVVQSIKKNLKVDWTEPPREDVKAGVRAAVGVVLRKRGVTPEDFEPIVGRVMGQAEALYADWPQAA